MRKRKHHNHDKRAQTSGASGRLNNSCFQALGVSGLRLRVYSLQLGWGESALAVVLFYEGYKGAGVSMRALEGFPPSTLHSTP